MVSVVVLKVFLKNNDKFGLGSTVLPIIDAYCRFVSVMKDGDKMKPQLAEEIMEYSAKTQG
jgi:hypothetical protein